MAPKMSDQGLASKLDALFRWVEANISELQGRDRVGVRGKLRQNHSAVERAHHKFLYDYRSRIEANASWAARLQEMDALLQGVLKDSVRVTFSSSTNRWRVYWMIPGVSRQQQIFVPCDVFEEDMSETPNKKTSKQANKNTGLLVAEKLRDVIRAAPNRSYSHVFFALRDELVADALNTMHTGSTRDTRVVHNAPAATTDVRGDSSASASADTR